VTAQLPLYSAIFSALSAAPPIGAGIYDAVPQNAPYPHIEISGGRAYDWSAQALRGEETVIEIHVWSRYRGYAEARDLLGKIKDRLHQATLSLSGATFIDCRFSDMELITDADGLTRHGVIRFAAWTSTAS
jgi:hypothetical protein